jgi:1-acyl-sn-glycerol-3-phosphate acyltransferase
LTVWLSIAIATWLVFAAACRILAATSPRPGDMAAGFAHRVIKLYVNIVHPTTVVGACHIPRESGPLIVVCNHTAGLDPALVQARCGFFIRWMMAKDMMLPQYREFWEWAEIIAVDRGARSDTGSAREAIRHLKNGGVLGVFPEGGIERPPGVLKPFMPGIGLIAARTNAPVLPVFIRDTPVVPQAWDSLWTPSHPSVTFGKVLSFPPGVSASEVTREIQAWFCGVSGWTSAEAAHDR